MIKKATNVELIEGLESLGMAVTGLLAKAKGEDELDVIVPDFPTDEEISMNVSGTPDLHIKRSATFNKMKKYYDPAKLPFTGTNWMTTMLMNKDCRSYKLVEIDGKMYRPKNPQMGPDWYWIERGVKDLLDTPMWFMEQYEGKLSANKKALFTANYKGGFRTGGVPGQG